MRGLWDIGEKRKTAELEWEMFKRGRGAGIYGLIDVQLVKDDPEKCEAEVRVVTYGYSIIFHYAKNNITADIFEAGKTKSPKREGFLVEETSVTRDLYGGVAGIRDILVQHDERYKALAHPGQKIGLRPVNEIA